MTRWYRLRRLLLVLLAGGVLLQTTTSCEQLIAPLIASLASEIVLNALLGGIGT